MGLHIAHEATSIERNRLAFVILMLHVSLLFALGKPILYKEEGGEEGEEDMREEKLMGEEEGWVREEGERVGGRDDLRCRA